MVPLHTLAIDQVSDIEHHLTALREPAADFLVERSEQPVHLETHRPRPCLALTLPHGILPKAGEVFAAYSLGRKTLDDLFGAAIVHEDLQVHLGFATEFFNVGEELALIGADGFAEGFVIVEYRSKTKWENGGVLKTIGDDAGVIDSGLVVEVL